MKNIYSLLLLQVLVFCRSVSGNDLHQEWCLLDLNQDLQPAIAFTFETGFEEVGFEVNVSLSKDVETCQLTIQKEGDHPATTILLSSNHSNDPLGWKVLKEGKVIRLTRIASSKKNVEGKYTLTFDNNAKAQFFVVSPQSDYQEEIPIFDVDHFTFETNNTRFKTCVRFNQNIKKTENKNLDYISCESQYKSSKCTVRPHNNDSTKFEIQTLSSDLDGSKEKFTLSCKADGYFIETVSVLVNASIPFCSLDPISSNDFIKGVYKPLASTQENLFRVFFKLTEEYDDCKLIVKHEDNPEEYVSLKNLTYTRWTFKKYFGTMILDRHYSNETDKPEMEGKYTLTFKNNVTTQFFVLFSKGTNELNQEKIHTLNVKNFTLQVKNKRLKICAEYNHWINQDNPKNQEFKSINCESQSNSSNCTVLPYNNSSNNFELNINSELLTETYFLTCKAGYLNVSLSIESKTDWCSLDATTSTLFYQGVDPTLAYISKTKFQVYLALAQVPENCMFTIEYKKEAPLILNLNNLNTQDWEIRFMQNKNNQIFLERHFENDTNKEDLEGKYTLTFKNEAKTQFFVLFPDRPNEIDQREIMTFYSRDSITLEASESRFQTCVQYNLWTNPTKNESSFISCQDQNKQEKCNASSENSDLTRFKISLVGDHREANGNYSLICKAVRYVVSIPFQVKLKNEVEPGTDVDPENLAYDKTTKLGGTPYWIGIAVFIILLLAGITCYGIKKKVC
jgi:hypothetical protein